METYLPFIKALLAEWYLFTLNNPLYAGALAIAVWLLTATLYSIRIAAIKRANAASEKIGAENLHTAQQQLQHSQEELATTIEHMEQAQLAAQDETQRALSLEQLIYQRNQQIAGIIQSLAINFDLGERPLLASEDVKADSLWQQHDKVINQLTDRLRSEIKAKSELQQTFQAETAKLAEKDAQLEVLQATLATHSNQLSRLEQALEEQKAILQQQDNAQQVLSNTLKNLQPVITRHVEPEAKPEPIKVTDTWQPPVQTKELPVVEDSPIVQPAQPVVQAVQETPVEPIIEAPQAEIALPIEEEKQVESEPPVAVETPALFDISPEPVIEETPFVTPDVEQQPVAAAPAKGSLGKIKTLFGKKQPPVKTEPQWSAAQSDETLSSNATDDEPQKTPGKLKGFYSKFRSKDK